MHKNLNSQPAKLSKKELQASRAGTLGRFPDPSLYEAEDKTGSDRPSSPEERKLAPASNEKHRQR